MSSSKKAISLSLSPAQPILIEKDLDVQDSTSVASLIDPRLILVQANITA